METTQTIEIKTNYGQRQSQINISDLCKIEISIIASMFHSKEFYNKIISSINTEDFTFVVTKKIFEYLIPYSNEVDFYGNEDEKIKVADDIYAFENIFVTTTLKILNSKPCKNIDLDLTELLHFSNKRKETFLQESDNGKSYATIKIEDEYGEYIAIYFNGIIIDIHTTYIFHLPEEICDTFEYTFNKIMPYVQKENFNLRMEINEDDAEDIRAFVLSKNTNKIEKLENLIRWADKNNFMEKSFPRNRGDLQNAIFFVLVNRGIEYIPDEFCEVLNQIKLLSLLMNQIKRIPQNIHLLENCLLLELCNNNIEYLPENLFQLEKLSILCLHGNKLQELPDSLGNLVNLGGLTLSNNSIKKLPHTIKNLTNLIELDIENTLIDENSLKYIILENIEKISFDDRLLPYFIENFHRLKNIDTINLSHSEYKTDNPIISSLGLNVENKDWMEDKDYEGHGCIVLKLAKASD